MSVPYTFGTNTYAQSGQIDANFAALNSSLSNIDASQITTGTLPVARGGTGATTAPAALTSLGAVAKAGDTMTGALTMSGAAGGFIINDRATGTPWNFFANGNDLQLNQGGPVLYEFVASLFIAHTPIQSTGSSAGIFWQDRVTTTTTWSWTGNSNVADLGNNLNANLLTVNNSGNVTQAGNSLNFAGTTSGGPFVYGDTSNMALQLGTGNGAFTFYNHGGTGICVHDGATGNLTITGSTATKPGSTAWVNPSTRDIKADIQPYEVGLQAILSLMPRTYRFRDDSGFDTADTHIGLVHDETAHMPEMHRKATIGGGIDEPGREVDALDCSPILFALVNAVKTLTARIEALEKK